MQSDDPPSRLRARSAGRKAPIPRGMCTYRRMQGSFPRGIAFCIFMQVTSRCVYETRRRLAPLPGSTQDPAPHEVWHFRNHRLDRGHLEVGPDVDSVPQRVEDDAVLLGVGQQSLSAVAAAVIADPDPDRAVDARGTDRRFLR